MTTWMRPETRGFNNTVLRKAALDARERNRRANRHGPGPSGHRRKPAMEEHYHVVYHVPAENLAIPYFKEVFTTVREANLKIADLGQRAEPQTEWYEDGQVGFETTVPGRLGLFWIIVEVFGCIRAGCAQYMTRDQRKRRFYTVPDDGDPVPTETNTAAVLALGPGSVTDVRDLGKGVTRP